METTVTCNDSTKMIFGEVEGEGSLSGPVAPNNMESSGMGRAAMGSSLCGEKETGRGNLPAPPFLISRLPENKKRLYCA